MKTHIAAAAAIVLGLLVPRTAESQLPEPTRLARPSTAGPIQAGLRLGYTVEARPLTMGEAFDVRVELINTTDRPLTLVSDWPHDQQGDFRDYVASATSIWTHPDIMVWGIQVMEDRREIAQSELTLGPHGTLSVTWTATNGRLKNHTIRPNTIRNPYFPSDGLYSTHAELLVRVVTAKSSDARPDEARHEPAHRSVLLRSNEQLVAIGESERAPKAAIATVQTVDLSAETAQIDLGTRHGLEVGDEFLLRTGMMAFWKLRVVEVGELTSRTEWERTSLGPGSLPQIRDHELPQGGQRAGLIPRAVEDWNWMWSHHSPHRKLAIKAVIRQVEAAVRGWELLHADAQPSVSVDGFEGYRIAVRRPFFEPLHAEIQQKAEVALPDSIRRNVDWEIVVIPLGDAAVPDELKSRIDWQPSSNPHHTRDVSLGKGYGYAWFTHATLIDQDLLRRRLGLEGGDDPLQLAADGLLIKDAGMNTANSVPYILARAGDRALPYITAAIERSQRDDPLRAVRTLHLIPTQRSTELLLRLFESDNERLQKAAEYALIHKPFRAEAKRAYLDMTRRHRYVNWTSLICVQFGWQEAIPVLRQVELEPRNLRELRDAFSARRTLEGRPISSDLIEAETLLMRPGQPPLGADQQRALQRARAILIESTDHEAATLSALALAVFVAKGASDDVRKSGLEVLRQRPRQATVRLLASIVERIDADSRPRIRKVLDAVQAGAG